MDKKTMNRRKFLKVLGSFSLGALVVPISHLFKKEKTHSLQTKSREAKFYKSSDHLAG